MSSKRVREILNPRIRSEVLELSDYRCFYCDKPFSKDNPITVDHIVPIALGGSNRLGNLVAAHSSCNGDKGDKPIKKYIDHNKLKARVKIYLGVSDFEWMILSLIRKTRVFLGLHSNKNETLD